MSHIRRNMSEIDRVCPQMSPAAQLGPEAFQYEENLVLDTENLGKRLRANSVGVGPSRFFSEMAQKIDVEFEAP